MLRPRQDVELYRVITCDAKVLLLELRGRCNELNVDGSLKEERPRGLESDQTINYIISINELPTKAPFRSVIYTYCRITKATWHNC